MILGKIITPFVLALLALPCTAQHNGNAHHQQMVSYSPSRSLLTGILRKESKFGPPGFGETPKTDPRVKIIVLILDAPITTVPNEMYKDKDGINVSRVAGVRSIQLWFNDAEHPLEVLARKHIGRRVKVEGVVDQATAPMEFTPIIMTVSKLTIER